MRTVSPVGIPFSSHLGLLYILAKKPVHNPVNFMYLTSLQKLSLALISLVCCFPTSPAHALPGQARQEVTAWINANPALRPSLGDGLSVRRFNTAAQRFSFEASVLPVSSLINVNDTSIIRKEQIAFYDVVNGISPDRLEESLRTIYGADIYQDYLQARVVYQYPSREQTELARRQGLPLLAARRGDLRLGDRFGYWLETTRGQGEQGANGQLTVFLREDLNQMESELRNQF
jgi:hypothetical protein